MFNQVNKAEMLLLPKLPLLASSKEKDSVLVVANREALLSHDAISRPPRPALSPKPHSIHIPSTKYSLPAQMRQSTYISSGDEVGPVAQRIRARGTGEGRKKDL
ncbi:hypothetical protein V6N12_075941 [Hibiscus sabdariffa]|uniref:Uncharacterized protein n=1 Tax=Hibiscus sabdariffa TaxID=183260 RepID=A0ABR2AXS8_9ROSI